MGKKIIVVTLLSLFIIPLISSAGVANSYWDDNPLKLAPGESATISLRLQNEEKEQITMMTSINSQIASLAGGNEYDVPPDRVSVPVYIDVEIPKDVEIGTEYIILVSFKQVSSEEGGMLQLSQGITGKVPVKIVGEEESELYGTYEEVNPLLYLILGVIVLGIIFFIIKRKTPSKK